MMTILRRGLAAGLLFLASALPHSLAHAQTAHTPPAGHVSGEAVYTLTKQFLAVAPKRFIGSPGHAAAEHFIQQHFAPEAAKGNLEVDNFSASTPVGLLPMRNFIVKFPSQGPARKDGIIVLASHYETNYPLRDINFVGANDGAATSALLIALGEHFRAHPPEGYSIWLVFFDGEEAIKDWSASDSLYGSRHLAARWSQTDTLGKIKAFLLADMIGDRDLNIDFDEMSTPWLRDLLKTAAQQTGHAGSIYKNSVPGLGDDHIPFVQRGVPSLDLIDIDYGPRTAEMPDGYHHTAQDTIDHVSAHSLQISADLFLALIRLINQR